MITNGRNSRGQFASGNPGGPGRPSKKSEAEYLSVVLAACPPDRWKTIVEKAVTDAEDGCHKARVWLAGFLTPEPGVAGSEPVDDQPNAFAAAISVLSVDELKFLDGLMEKLERVDAERAAEQPAESVHVLT